MRRRLVALFAAVILLGTQSFNSVKANQLLHQELSVKMIKNGNDAVDSADVSSDLFNMDRDSIMQEEKQLTEFSGTVHSQSETEYQDEIMGVSKQESNDEVTNEEHSESTDGETNKGMQSDENTPEGNEGSSKDSDEGMLPVDEVSSEENKIKETADEVEEDEDNNKLDTQSELQEAISQGGNIVLLNDIVLTEPLTFQKDVIIDGNGYTLSISDAMNGRHGIITGNAVVVLQNIRLSGKGTSIGGGIYVEGGSLELRKGTVLEHNIADKGGAIQLVKGTLTADEAVISNNRADGQGGGIWADSDSSLSLQTASVRNNTAGKQGGGIYYIGRLHLPLHVTIADNLAENGGGIYSDEVIVDGAVVSGNQAINNSSSIYTEGMGGGIYGEQVTVNNGVISLNTGIWGGGVYGTYVTVNGGEISKNTAVFLFTEDFVSSGYSAGGGVYALSSFVMTDGLIQDNLLGSLNSKDSINPVGGGGVAVADNGTVNMSGGEIKDNNYTRNTRGGGISAGKNSKVVISGNSVISGNYANGDGSKGGGISVLENSEVILRDNAKISGNKAFTGGGVMIEGKSKITLFDNSGVVENEARAGTGIYAAMTIDGGSFRKTAIVIINGGEVSRNRTPKGISTSSGAAVYGYQVFLNGGKINENYVDVGHAPAVMAYELNMSDGQINNNTINQTNTAYFQGFVFCNRFYMSGGEIKDNKRNNASSKLYGGGVYVELPAGDMEGKDAVHISGGEISGNSATFGGGVMVTMDPKAKNNTLRMSGGVITGNRSVSGGGGLFVSGKSTANGNRLIIEGGKISDNETSGYGGGVGSSSTNVSVRGKAEITNNRSDGIGGGMIVYSDGAALDMDGGSEGILIASNHSKTRGGGIWVDNLNRLTVNGVLFKNNTASQGYFMNDETDIALYRDKIKVLGLSAPFTEFAYNNYDIVYTKGLPLSSLYTITFDGNGGTVGVSSLQVKPGDTVDRPENPTRYDYQFKYWTETKDGSGSIFKFNGEENATVMPYGNIILYAQWDKITGNPNPPDKPEPPDPPIDGGENPDNGGSGGNGGDNGGNDGGSGGNNGGNNGGSGGNNGGNNGGSGGNEHPTDPPAEPEDPNGGLTEIPNTPSPEGAVPQRPDNSGSSNPSVQLPAPENPLPDSETGDSQLEEVLIPEEIITDPEIPLSPSIPEDETKGTDDRGWGLFNLISLMFSLAAAFVLIYMDMKEKEEAKRNQMPKVSKDRKHRIMHWIIICAAVLSALIFTFTQDISAPMRVADIITPILAALLLIQAVIIFILSENKKKLEVDKISKD